MHLRTGQEVRRHTPNPIGHTLHDPRATQRFEPTHVDIHRSAWVLVSLSSKQNNMVSAAVKPLTRDTHDVSTSLCPYPSSPPQSHPLAVRPGPRRPASARSAHGRQCHPTDCGLFQSLNLSGTRSPSMFAALVMNCAKIQPLWRLIWRKGSTGNGFRHI